MKIILLILLILIVNSQISTQQCSCSQLLTEADCFMSTIQACNWNSFKKSCYYGAINSQQNQDAERYCDQFSSADCKKLQPCETCVNDGPCQWYDGKCSHFTGCTAFFGNTNNDCQSKSERCITDGTHCVEIGTCDSYLTETACKQDLKQKWCFWNNNTKKCTYPQTCEELPLTFTQDYQCKSQISTCVSNKFGGCQTQIQKIETQVNSLSVEYPVKYSKCSEIILNSECQSYQNGINCFWKDNQCLDKTCQNAPNTLKSNSDCQSFLSYCITTSGGGCVNNGTCQIANIKEACQKDIRGIDCYWNVNECVQKTCDHAPSTITNAVDCDLFLKNQCVTKDGGGCRTKQCEDLVGSSHRSCNTLKSDCTIGYNSKCAKIQTCENTTIKEACIAGLDGSCLWIVNPWATESKQGKCYRYNSCQSILWQTDQQCKQISTQCTTDGTKCVPITKCSETNTNGGCVTGSDGKCIQTVTAIKQTTTICKVFDSCTQAYYLTHDECNRANQQCTSDGINGCVPISDCTAYITKEACKINNTFKLCFWDSTAEKCRYSTCSDFNYTTHLQCQNISTNIQQKCTSDGVSCLAQANCSTYNKESLCNIAKGSDGICIWQANLGSCNVKQCSDISTPSSTNCSLEIGNCTFDGTKCIQWAQCSQYKTKTACNTYGLDGICYWSQLGLCGLMTTCQSANEDEQACLQAKQYCYWKSSTRKCDNHNCQTFQIQHGTCSTYQNWTDKQQYLCKEIQGKCTNIDPVSLLQSECYKLSSYTYSWNPTTSRCTICNKNVVTIPNNTNGTNTTNPPKNNTNNTTNNNNNNTNNNTNNNNNTNSTGNQSNNTAMTTDTGFIITSYLLLMANLLS